MNFSIRRRCTFFNKVSVKAFWVVVICSLITFSPVLVYSQTAIQKISGLVVDQSGEPIIGASVKGESPQIGTITNASGNFSLEVPLKSKLVFSYIGYSSQTITYTGQKTIKIILLEDSKILDEFVVIGYGVQKKATLSGSIETIKSDVFESRAITNPSLALQGQTPGLVVTRTSGRPGQEDISMSIRGATSVNGGSPLIIIDGSPVSNSESFYSMNQDDIESMTVLKDGSAAIYGSRAANGVILVTTKIGKGKIKVDINSNFRLNSIGIRPPTPSMSEYATVWLEAANQDGAQAQYWFWENRQNLERMQRGEAGIYFLSTPNINDYIYMGNHSRFDEMYGNSFSNQQNVSVSGSNANSNFRFSLGYDENVGALVTTYDGIQKYNLRSNYNFTINKWLKIESGISYFSRKQKGPSVGLTANSISQDPPLFPSVNPYGQWYANFGKSGGVNSVAESVDGGRETTLTDQIKINIAAIFDITKDLNIKATATFDNEHQNYQKYILTVPTYTWSGELANNKINPTSYIREENYKSNYENYGIFANYNKNFGNHSLGAMVGVTAEKKVSKELSGYRQGFEDNGVYDLSLGSVESSVVANGGSAQWGFLSYVARINYNYKNKYLLELSGRRDGSSKFHKDYRFSNFGGASAGWVLTEENFMKNVEFLSFLKLRGSYGEMGNQVGIGNYDYISSMSFGTAVFGDTPALQNTARLSGLTSNTRTWERVKILSGGIDMQFLNNRLTGSFDIYNKVNDNMLISITYPEVLGGTAPKSNSGTLQTKGWEASLGWKDKVGNFKYSINVNIGDSRNKITKMDGTETWNAGVVATRVGFPVNSYFLYQTDGFFANEEQVTDYYNQYGAKGEITSQTAVSERLRPGDTRKIDLDGNGYISYVGDGLNDTGDVKFMGDKSPHYVYGINLNMEYKGFDFTSFFQGALEHNILRIGNLAYPFAVQWSNQTTAFIDKTWTPETSDSKYPRMTANINRSRWNYLNNDFMLQNNQYIRLKSLVVGYSFRNIAIKNFRFEKIRIFFSGSDLFEFSKVKDGYDPEFGDSANNSYPFSRTYSLGLNVTF